MKRTTVELMAKGRKRGSSQESYERGDSTKRVGELLPPASYYRCSQPIRVRAFNAASLCGVASPVSYTGFHPILFNLRSRKYNKQCTTYSRRVYQGMLDSYVPPRNIDDTIHIVQNISTILQKYSQYFFDTLKTLYRYGRATEL